ncbi:MAG: hypothetical protein IIB71_08680 [Proteobacteria bacterium]|nr:hypothetical protein [Pseudomonadota bacterium]
MIEPAEKLSLPILSMLVGMVSGIGLGIALVIYLQVESILNQVCVVGISLLAFQLFGAAVGSAMGKGK